MIELNRIAFATADAPGGPAPEAAADAPAAAPETSAAPEAAAPVEATPVETKPAPAAPAEKSPDWKDRRIARLTAQLKEAKNAAPQTAAPAQPGKLDPTEDFNRRVSEAAAAQTAANRFNEKSNAAAAAGRAKYGKDEFNSSIRSLVAQFVPDDQDRAALAKYNAFITAALATGHAEDVIYELGRNLDDAETVMEMEPLELTAELTRRFALPAAPAGSSSRNEISSAPKPIRPVTGGNESLLDPSNPDQAGKLSTAEWMRRRNEQVAKQSAR